MCLSIGILIFQLPLGQLFYTDHGLQRAAPLYAVLLVLRLFPTCDEGQTATSSATFWRDAADGASKTSHASYASYAAYARTGLL